MNECIIHKITKYELVKLNENDLVFITSSGRMRDEDGITFIIKYGKYLFSILSFHIIYKYHVFLYHILHRNL